MNTATRKTDIEPSARTRKTGASFSAFPGRSARMKKVRPPESLAREPRHHGSGNDTPHKFRDGIVRKTADQIPPATKADLERLSRAMVRSDAEARRNGGDVSVSEPRRLIRNANGRITKPPPGRIRSAILAELGRRQMSRYRLWKIARKDCPTLTQSAVYEFLRGVRQLRLGYVEAMLWALNLRVITMSEKHRS